MAADPSKSFRRLVFTGFLVIGGLVVLIVILILAVLIFTHGHVSFT